jgi:hypothetical protein
MFKNEKEFNNDEFNAIFDHYHTNDEREIMDISKVETYTFERSGYSSVSTYGGLMIVGDEPENYSSYDTGDYNEVFSERMIGPQDENEINELRKIRNKKKSKDDPLFLSLFNSLSLDLNSDSDNGSSFAFFKFRRFRISLVSFSSCGPIRI